MRHLAKLATACVAVLLSLSFSGCNSKDAGETLQIGLDDIGVVMLSESISEEAKTPTKYEATTKVFPRVAYKGTKELGYQWSVQSPGTIGIELSSSENSAELKSTVLAIGSTQPDLGSGVGSIRLTVYEKTGTLSKTVVSKLYFIASNGG